MFDLVYEDVRRAQQRSSHDKVLLQIKINFVLTNHTLSYDRYNLINALNQATNQTCRSKHFYQHLISRTCGGLSLGYRREACHAVMLWRKIKLCHCNHKLKKDLFSTVLIGYSLESMCLYCVPTFVLNLSSKSL